jgi:hypothetical protein
MEKDEQDLTSKLGEVMSRVEVIPGEVVALEARMGKRKADLEQTLKDIEDSRKERQGLLVRGGDVDPISKKIRRLWEKVDLIEDEVLGLMTKRKELDIEGQELAKQKSFLQDEILKARLVPLVERFNRSEEEADINLRAILALMDERHLPYGPEGWGKFVIASSWIGLRTIPRLYLPGDEPRGDFFNIREIQETKQREALKGIHGKLSESLPTPGPEA